MGTLLVKGPVVTEAMPDLVSAAFSSFGREALVNEKREAGYSGHSSWMQSAPKGAVCGCEQSGAEKSLCCP